MQTGTMIKKTKKIAIALSVVLLLSCVSNSQDSKVVKKQPDDIVKTVEIPMVEEGSFEDGRPVDIAPLVSNYLAARLSEREGRIADAAFFYDRAEAADPQNKELKEHAFILQLALGNMEESIRLARELVGEEDAMPMGYILLGADALIAGELDEAKRSFKRAQKISPALLQFHVLAAYIDLEQGKPADVVVAKLKELPVAAGLSAVRHYHFARLLEKAGRLDEAKVEYEFALEADSRSSFTILALERIYEKMGAPEKTKAMFKAFFKANPENVMLLKSAQRIKAELPYEAVSVTLAQDAASVVFEIATLMSSQKLHIAADQVLNISLLLDPHNAFTFFYKGITQEQAGAYEEAIDTYSAIPVDAYTWLGGQIRMADIYTKQSKPETAIAFVEGLAKDHDNVIIQRILAELYYNNGRYEKAIKLYDHLFSLKEDEPSKKDFWMYFARGTAYERLARFEEAEKDLKESIRIMPNNATALNYLGYMWIERDNHIDEAFQLIGRALLIKPKDASILDSMGWVLYKKAEFEKSLVYLKRAAKYRPDDATINMHLGDVYEKLERFEEAHKHWQRALLLKPETQKDTLHVKMKLNEVSAKLK